jgi:hypothetical protein
MKGRWQKAKHGEESGMEEPWRFLPGCGGGGKYKWLVGTRDEMQMKLLLLYYRRSGNLVDFLEDMGGTRQDRTGQAKGRRERLTGR